MLPCDDGSKSFPLQQSTGDTVGASAPTHSAAVLFLDVDGVLNRSGKSRQGLDSESVLLLKQIVDETGCGIVVSSTWRKFDHSRQAIVNCLIDIGAILRGFTPELEQQGELWSATPRGLEIEAWLNANPEVNHFVILDDDDETGSLGPHWVRTSSADGLTADVAAEVIRRLKVGSSTDGDGRPGV